MMAAAFITRSMGPSSSSTLAISALTARPSVTSAG